MKSEEAKERLVFQYHQFNNSISTEKSQDIQGKLHSYRHITHVLPRKQI